MNNSSEPDPTTTGTDKVPAFPPSFVYPVATCHILIVAVAVLGNLIVCYAIITNKSLRSSPTNLFIFSLAFSDLFTATLAVPFDIEGLFLNWAWKHGEIMCEAWITIYLITVPTSILTLLAVSVDRYKSLKDPLNRFRRFRFMTRKRALIVISVIWLYSLIFALIPVMGWRAFKEFVYEGVCYFPFTEIYSTLSSCLNFIIPLLVTCGIYVKIYLIARSQSSTFDKEISLQMRTTEACSRQTRSTEEKKIYLKNIRAAKTISIFVAVFFFCWVPHSFISITANLCQSCRAKIPNEVRVLVLMFGYLNSALNPFLFAFRNKRFKAAYSALLRTMKARPLFTSSLRRRSTLTASTCHSELPDLQDSVVRLQLAKTKRESWADKRQSALWASDSIILKEVSIGNRIMTNKILIFLRSMLGCVWGGSESVYCLCRLNNITLAVLELFLFNLSGKKLLLRYFLLLVLKCLKFNCLMLQLWAKKFSV